jgi:hypothetical protein
LFRVPGHKRVFFIESADGRGAGLGRGVDWSEFAAAFDGGDDELQSQVNEVHVGDRQFNLAEGDDAGIEDAIQCFAQGDGPGSARA